MQEDFKNFDILSVKEAAELLNKSTRTVRNYIDAGKLKKTFTTTSLGQEIRVYRVDVENLQRSLALGDSQPVQSSEIFTTQPQVQEQPSEILRRAWEESDKSREEKREADKRWHEQWQYNQNLLTERLQLTDGRDHIKAQARKQGIAWGFILGFGASSLVFLGVGILIAFRLKFINIAVPQLAQQGVAQSTVILQPVEKEPEKPTLPVTSVAEPVIEQPAQQVQEVQEPVKEEPLPKQLKIKQMCNLRAGASADTKAVSILKQGDMVIELERQGNWVKVQAETGQEGWVNQGLVISQ